MSHPIPPDGLESPSSALVLRADSVGELAPLVLERNAVQAVAPWAGPHAADETLRFLSAQIRNPNTRRAYHHAISRFVSWCAVRSIELRQITAPLIAAYLDELKMSLRPPSVKVHMAALKMWCRKLVLGHVLPYSPATEVCGERYSQTTGKTPVMSSAEARQLLASVDATTLQGARDRALMALMLHSFARIGAVLQMRVVDYRGAGTQSATFLLHEKGGKDHRVPAHHKACEYLDAYLVFAGLAAQPGAPMWQGIRAGKLTGKPLTQAKSGDMIKRRCRAAGLSDEFSNHSFRATGITLFRKAGGDLRVAQQLAAHADVKTTALYDRSGEDVQRAEVERVQLRPRAVRVGRVTGRNAR